MARAPLEGMASEAPRVDVGDFAAKRAGHLGRAKALREQKGLAVAIQHELDLAGWEKTKLDPEFAEDLVREEYKKGLPPRWSFLHNKIGRWSKPCLPTMYLSMKSKC